MMKIQDNLDKMFKTWSFLKWSQDYLPPYLWFPVTDALKILIVLVTKTKFSFSRKIMVWIFLERKMRCELLLERKKETNIKQVDIHRGLPEGSRLSPTLFAIFVSDLIHELQTKFPHAVINLAPGLQHNGTTQIWIGGLLYVDDLALMSTCPRELQAMLHVCQEWSIRNRMQINTQKTKVMAFFETPFLQKARGGQHRPGPTLPPFHIHAPFPISSPCPTSSLRYSNSNT